MIVLLDTSTPTCKLALIGDDEQAHDYEWLADRSLARGIHAYIRDRLAEHQAEWHDISAIGVMQGPGSFTGLRIGLTVANTLADALKVPIVGATGNDWQAAARQRLVQGDNDQLVMPIYGAEANITRPRK